MAMHLVSQLPDEIPQTDDISDWKLLRSELDLRIASYKRKRREAAEKAIDQEEDGNPALPDDWIYCPRGTSGKCSHPDCDVEGKGTLWWRLKGSTDEFLCPKCMSALPDYPKRVNLYLTETEAQAGRRSEDRGEWKFVPYAEDRVTERDVKCLRAFDVCYYTGNSSRLQRYKGHYCLKGRPDKFYYCDVCFEDVMS